MNFSFLRNEISFPQALKSQGLCVIVSILFFLSEVIYTATYWHPGSGGIVGVIVYLVFFLLLFFGVLRINKFLQWSIYAGLVFALCYDIILLAGIGGLLFLPVAFISFLLIPIFLVIGIVLAIKERFGGHHLSPEGAPSGNIPSTINSAVLATSVGSSNNEVIKAPSSHIFLGLLISFIAFMATRYIVGAFLNSINSAWPSLRFLLSFMNNHIFLSIIIFTTIPGIVINSILYFLVGKSLKRGVLWGYTFTLLMTVNLLVLAIFLADTYHL